MCRRVQCESCGKPTYAGCGMHIEQVLAGVPVEERCHCRDAKDDPKSEEKAAPSVMRRIFGG
ncbi:MAG TPA: hypothetical protein VK550_34580 [Polyangiaceae bacterium]|nr:hypothetical protein [Polyangiaceae bacterium]